MTPIWIAGGSRRATSRCAHSPRCSAASRGSRERPSSRASSSSWRCRPAALPILQPRLLSDLGLGVTRSSDSWFVTIESAPAEGLLALLKERPKLSAGGEVLARLTEALVLARRLEDMEALSASAEGDLIVCSLDAAGVGLTLTAASNVASRWAGRPPSTTRPRTAFTASARPRRAPPGTCWRRGRSTSGSQRWSTASACSSAPPATTKRSMPGPL